MICPKCGAEQGEEKLECMRCGVIFAKLTPEDFGHSSPESKIKAAGPTQESWWANTIKVYILVSDPEENHLIWAGRLLAYLIIFFWGWKFIVTPMASDYFAQTFLHGVNLVFHEADHIIFGFLGSFLGVFGGSLGQILMPLICLGAFLFTGTPSPRRLRSGGWERTLWTLRRTSTTPEPCNYPSLAATSGVITPIFTTGITSCETSDG